MDPTSLRLMQGASGISAGVEFIASAQAQNNGINIDVSKPTGTVANDLMIMFGATENGQNADWSGASGWTEVAEQAFEPCLRVAYKVAGGSEPSSYTFSMGSIMTASVVIVTFRKAAYDTVGTISSSTTQTASAITLSTSSSAILAFFARARSSTTWSNPTSGLISTATDSDSTAPSFALYHELGLSSGSTGTRSATPSSTAFDELGCVLVGIKPA